MVSVTAFATIAVISAWVVGTCWGCYLTLKHLDQDLSALDSRLAVLETDD